MTGGGTDKRTAGDESRNPKADNNPILNPSQVSVNYPDPFKKKAVPKELCSTALVVVIPNSPIPFSIKAAPLQIQ